jgi:hypothetical protein
MNQSTLFRILTPEGRFSRDTFVLSPHQPAMMKPGCVLVVHQRTARLVTVHETRLFPVRTSRPQRARVSDNVCTRCGHVAGVTEDQVACSAHGASCGLNFVESWDRSRPFLRVVSVS